jgi:hypothetical protein
MIRSQRVRRFHRAMSIVFTVAVIVTTVVLAREEPPAWVSYLALPPLFILWSTGMYLLAELHVTKWRGGRRTRARAHPSE